MAIYHEVDHENTSILQALLKSPCTWPNVAIVAIGETRRFVTSVPNFDYFAWKLGMEDRGYEIVRTSGAFLDEPFGRVAINGPDLFPELVFWSASIQVEPDTVFHPKTGSFILNVEVYAGGVRVGKNIVEHVMGVYNQQLTTIES